MSELPNSKTFGGNCMGCFWHSEYQNASLCRTHPKEVDWLIKEEEKHGHTFNKNGSWKELRKHALNKELDLFDVEDYFCQEVGGSCGQ